MKKNLLMFSIFLSILFLIIIVYVSKDISVQEDYLSLTNKYGSSYNSIRSSRNIPVIESDWVLHEIDSNYMYWSNRQRKVTEIKPFHLYKSIYLKSGKINYEKNAFHYEGNDERAYRLMVFNSMKETNGRLDSFKLITYFKGLYPPSESKVITKEQADSVIVQWKRLNESLRLE